MRLDPVSGGGCREKLAVHSYWKRGLTPFLQTTMGQSPHLSTPVFLKSTDRVGLFRFGLVLVGGTAHGPSRNLVNREDRLLALRKGKDRPEQRTYRTHDLPFPIPKSLRKWDDDELGSIPNMVVCLFGLAHCCSFVLFRFVRH